MSSNFGPLTRDNFSSNIHIKGAKVIDAHQNIVGNAITSSHLKVTGNAVLGNIVSNHLITSKIVSSEIFIGSMYGPVFDASGTQILHEQQPAVNDPSTVSAFIPGSNVNDGIIPVYSMPPLGVSVMPTSLDIKQNSVEHLLYYNHVQLRNEVESLKTQVVQLLNALRSHGLISS
jgi:hypothetical protein